MKNQFTITPKGDINPVWLEDFYRVLDYPRTGISLENTFQFPVSYSHSLVINPLTDSFEIIDQETLEELKMGTLDPTNPLYPYYADRFPIKTAELKTAFRNFYDNHISMKQGQKTVSFIFVMTYTCNMACVYCYQQEHHTKSIMTQGALGDIFQFIKRRVEEEKSQSPRTRFTIELFGGEPLQESTISQIKEIFEFAERIQIGIIISTNGVDFNSHEEAFQRHRKNIGRVCTTLDGPPEQHNKKRLVKEKEGSFDVIVGNIRKFLSLGIPVTIATNLDRLSLNHIEDYFLSLDALGFTENDLVCLEIGRVDDRMYSTGYDQILLESELLAALLKFDETVGLPKNIRFAFLKTSLNIMGRFGLGYNSSESGRSYFHYCWTTSPVDQVYYIDPDLDVYRCTYSVGNKQRKIGNIKGQIEDAFLYNHGFLENKECYDCIIGNYCSGNCYFSFTTDKNRTCVEEKRNFNVLIEEILLPRIKQKWQRIQKSYEITA